MTAAPPYPSYPAGPPPLPPAMLPVGPMPPPPGPGVQPPFPAPPVEGRGRRIGWGLGIGAGVFLLVFGGGVAAVIGLGTSMSKALNEQAHVVVGQYLNAVHDQKYDAAYSMLCQQARDDETAGEYRSRVAAEERIDSYQLGSIDLVNLTLPVDATYSGGDTAKLEAYLGQNTDTGEFEVCDVGE